MSEKTLKIVFGLTLVAMLWQLVALRGQLADAKEKVISLGAQLDGLRRADADDARHGKVGSPEVTSATIAELRAAIHRLEQRSNRTPLTQPDPAELAATPEQALWTEQRQAMEDVQVQLQELVGSVDAIQSEMQNLSASMLELQASTGSIESDISAIGGELVRLGASAGGTAR